MGKEAKQLREEMKHQREEKLRNQKNQNLLRRKQEIEDLLKTKQENKDLLKGRQENRELLTRKQEILHYDNCFKKHENEDLSKIWQENLSYDNCPNMFNKINDRISHLKQTHISSKRKELKIHRNPYIKLKTLRKQLTRSRNQINHLRMNTITEELRSIIIDLKYNRLNAEKFQELHYLKEYDSDMQPSILYDRSMKERDQAINNDLISTLKCNQLNDEKSQELHSYSLRKHETEIHSRAANDHTMKERDLTINNDLTSILKYNCYHLTKNIRLISDLKLKQRNDERFQQLYSYSLRKCEQRHKPKVGIDRHIEEKDLSESNSLMSGLNHDLKSQKHHTDSFKKCHQDNQHRDTYDRSIEQNDQTENIRLVSSSTFNNHKDTTFQKLHSLSTKESDKDNKLRVTFDHGIEQKDRKIDNVLYSDSKCKELRESKFQEIHNHTTEKCDQDNQHRVAFHRQSLERDRLKTELKEEPITTEIEELSLYSPQNNDQLCTKNKSQIKADFKFKREHKNLERGTEIKTRENLKINNKNPWEKKNREAKSRRRIHELRSTDLVTENIQISSPTSNFSQNFLKNFPPLSFNHFNIKTKPSSHSPPTDNNSNSSTNSRQFKTNESGLQTFHMKCQHFLYKILQLCCCFWHIYGFPLVLEKIFKYLKDSIVHVLTPRLKTSSSSPAAATIKIATPTSPIDTNYGNISTAASGGKFKKPTKMSDFKAKQQNVLRTQTPTTITQTKETNTNTSSSFLHSTSLSPCSGTTAKTTTSLTYTATPGNLILLLNQQPHKTVTPYCHYQQHNHQHHQQYRQQTSQQENQQLQSYHHHQQYNSIATTTTSSSSQTTTTTTTTSTTPLHLQLPSLLVFSRTLIILILLSSLWHTSEGFHGSGVKLSTNTVKTKYGLVRGIVVRSSPSLVEAYLGIPYASPPVGSLRFMPPITPSTWKNVRNADRFSPVCPQNVPIPPNGPEALLEVPRARLAQLRRLLPLLSNQSEDCLYLNIYVPYENRRHRRFTTNSGEANDSPKLPTILFIHGESYEWNSGNPYDGSELAAHGNVIVVTINFRLGILGFLKTGGKESAQGNFGLMDLVAGLHWLKENLPAFGGDPQAITLLGHGTGAALANILVVSPVASDLIQHTVMVSGSALSPWAIQKNPLFVKRRVAEQTGCHGDMLYYDLAPCLRTKTLAELLAVKIDHPRFLVGFAPFIDGTVISPNTDGIGKLSLPLGSAIVSTSGIEYANFPKRNLIFCLTSVESHLDLSAQDLEFGFNETRRDRILRTYVRNNFHYHLNEIFAVLKNEYTDWDKAIRSPLSSRDATLQFLSDGHTASSLIKLGYMHSLRGGRGYFLHFKHRTVEEEYPQRTGSVRGEDVPFWLGLPISPLFPHNYTTQEKQISRLMLRYLANFAKTGNPNQSSLSSPLPSASSLIGGSPSSASSSSSSSSSSASSSTSNQAADDTHDKVKRSSFNIVNATTSSTSSGPIKSNTIVEDVATAAAREALNLAVLYNQRRTKRTYYKRHSRSNDDHSGSSASNEVKYFLSNKNNNNINNLDSDELPFWDAYDVVNQLYMELGNKAEIQSHYRGHKLSMWLNLIPQLHRHANMNDQSMRHHQFQDDLNNLNLYEGIVRAQIQTKPDDDDETLLLPKGRPTPPPPAQETNTTQKPNAGTTECGVDGAMFVAEMTTVPPSDNHSLVLDSREKEMATASTGLIGNLEVLRRLSGKQFQSYTTALVATVAVGCFLLILNILIFAGIYHQREKRARDAKTKEELQDNDNSKNSSMLKLNALGSETGSFNGSGGAGVSGKTTVVFGEYSCYDEKSLQTKDEKLIVELPPPQMVDPNWAACSTSNLDLIKTKHHTPLDTSYTLSNVIPINTESQTEHLMAVNTMEMATYNPMATGLIIDPSLAATSTSGLLSKRGSFVGSSGQLNQYDFASVQSSDQMSFKDIENAVKASATMDDDITHDDDIPEPPPPPRSFHSMQQQQQQVATSGTTTAASGSGGGGGILRQAGTGSANQTGGGKKRVHIQEISV